jgi:hypothetical protein
VITGPGAIGTNGPTDTAANLVLTNTGTINGEILDNSGVALPGGSFAGSQIYNSGAINGQIYLDSGNDLYGGTLVLGNGLDVVYGGVEARGDGVARP